MSKSTERSAWSVVCSARSASRPRASDYIEHVFSDFEPIFGDRKAKECGSILTGFARLQDREVMLIAQEKGRNLHERLRANFGMTTPYGFQKAIRAMHLAEKFHLPLITLIDTPGADCGIEAELANQSNRISESLAVMSRLQTPIISMVIGEGMSGGGLALSVADVLGMLSGSIYSVISPEGCASILFKDQSKKQVMADALKITPHDLMGLGLIDMVFEESNAHYQLGSTTMYQALATLLYNQLRTLQTLPLNTVLASREKKWSLANIPAV